MTLRRRRLLARLAPWVAVLAGLAVLAVWNWVPLAATAPWIAFAIWATVRDDSGEPPWWHELRANWLRGRS